MKIHSVAVRPLRIHSVAVRPMKIHFVAAVVDKNRLAVAHTCSHTDEDTSMMSLLALANKHLFAVVSNRSMGFQVV